MEATVLEVVLDAGAADPADPSVDHDELAMVDVSQRAEVPPCRAPAAERPGGRANFVARTTQTSTPAAVNRSYNAREPPLRVGPLPVDDEPDGDAFRAFAISASANESPTTPGRKPNWLMWMEDEAEAMSSSIGG